MKCLKHPTLSFLFEDILHKSSQNYGNHGDKHSHSIQSKVNFQDIMGLSILDCHVACSVGLPNLIYLNSLSDHTVRVCS